MIDAKKAAKGYVSLFYFVKNNHFRLETFINQETLHEHNYAAATGIFTARKHNGVSKIR
jgi:hypothetical protein